MYEKAGATATVIVNVLLTGPVPAPFDGVTVNVLI